MAIQPFRFTPIFEGDFDVCSGPPPVRPPPRAEEKEAEPEEPSPE